MTTPRGFEGLTDEALMGLVRASLHRWRGRWPAFGEAMRSAVRSEQDVRWGRGSVSPGFIAPALSPVYLPQLIMSLAGFSCAAQERALQDFTVQVIGDLIAAADDSHVA